MADRPPPVSAARRLLHALALGAAGLLLAGSATGHLAWLALCAPALGCLAARAGLSPAVALLPLAWALPLLGAPRPGLPTPLWGLCAVAGLFALGLGLGQLLRRPPLERAGAAGVLLLVTLLLSLAPARAGLAHDPWPPAVASRLLDLSPTVLVMECAGSDWMRHPLVYEPVGSDRFERRAWRGTLAGPTLLLVGYLFAAGAYLASRRFLDRDVRAPGAG